MHTRHHSHPYRKKFGKNGLSLKGPQPIGILKIQPNVSDEKIEEFKKLWTETVTGIGNAMHPIINNDYECKFIPLISPKRARFLLYVKAKQNDRERIGN